MRSMTWIGFLFSALEGAGLGMVASWPNTILREYATMRNAVLACEKRRSSCASRLFVTCLVDLMRPRIGFAALRLLEAAGCEVIVPETQTCCGQPAFNSRRSRRGARAGEEGDRRIRGLRIRRRALRFLRRPDPQRTIPVCSPDDAGLAGARRGAAPRRSIELTDFLVNVAKLDSVPGDFDGSVTYHDSCAGLREPRHQSSSRAHLLAKLPGVRTDGDGRRRGMLRLRRHLLGQVRRDLGAPSPNASAPTSRPAAPMPSSVATSAACSTSKASCGAWATRRRACCTSPKCWREND